MCEYCDVPANEVQFFDGGLKCVCDQVLVLPNKMSYAGIHLGLKENIHYFLSIGYKCPRCSFVSRYILAPCKNEENKDGDHHSMAVVVRSGDLDRV